MENPFSASADGRSTDVSYNDIAQKLLKDKLWLTALEFHCELVEAGRELGCLKDFFSNPVNFESSRLEVLPNLQRSSSQATLDSLDLTRFSEDGERAQDERVAVLEFELRKAREMIASLRNNLTVASGAVTSPSSESETMIKPHERRALNFLVNEYMLLNGYKLTSITFADENEDQDFEDWDDVGLNMPKPSDLLHLYRLGIKYSTVTSSSIETQTGSIPNLEELIHLKEKVLTLEEALEQTTNRKMIDAETQCEIVSEGSEEPEIVSQSGVDLSESFEMVNRVELPTLDASDGKLFPELNETVDEDEAFDDDSRLDQAPTLFKIPTNFAPSDAPSSLSNFEREVWSYLVQLKPLDHLPDVSHESLVSSLGSSLALIVQQLPVNNKEWLSRVVPLLVYMIGLHPDEKVKSSLVHCLLSIKKRPTQDDRNVIIAGIVRLCENVEILEAVHSDLLSRCSELMSDKYPERRVLVAQVCAHISPLISHELRDSLLVSMLKQLMEDKDEGVRAQAVTSLSVIGCRVVREKYGEMEQLVLRGLRDKSSTVVKVTQQVLLTVTAKLALDWEVLHTQLLPNLFNSLESIIGKQDKDTTCCNLIGALTVTLPYVVMFAATADEVVEQISPSLPPPVHRSAFAEVCKSLGNPKLFYEKHSVGTMISSFDYCLQNVPPWTQLTWIIDTLIPKILSITEKVHPTSECLKCIVSYFANLTAGFGAIFTAQHVKPIFLEHIEQIENKLMAVEKRDGWPSLNVPIVYILGVLAPLTNSDEELGQTLSRLMLSVSFVSGPLDCLHLAVQQLASVQRLMNPLLSALWQGVGHQSASVRKATASLLIDAVPHCPEQTIASRIIPALVTLASDPDPVIRVATLPIYGLILEKSSNREVLEKTYIQIQEIVSDHSSKNNSSLMIQMIKALGSMASHTEATFREEVIFFELGNLTKSGFDSHEAKRSEVAACLVEVLSNLIFLQISKSCISNTLIPTLRLLETFCKEAMQSHVETVTAMIRELEIRAGFTPVGSSPVQSTSQPSVTSPTPVSEMKQKMTKIFNAKPPNLPGIFWNKK